MPGVVKALVSVVVFAVSFQLAGIAAAAPATVPTKGTISLTGTTIQDKNVKAALQWLKDHGAAEQAAKIEQQIRDGDLKWDAAESANADTSIGGTITLTGAKVGVFGRHILDFQQRGDLGDIIALALTLFHERIHVERHSGVAGGCGRMASNAKGLTGFSTPHEIEAWTETLQLGISWLDQMLRDASGARTVAERLEALRLLDTMAGTLISLVGSFEENKFYGESAANKAQWLGLKKDLENLRKALQSDLEQLAIANTRLACFKSCEDAYLAAISAGERVAQIQEALDARRQALQRLQQRHANAQADLQKAKDAIARGQRQMGQARSKTERDLIASHIGRAIDDRNAAQSRIDKLPSLDAAKARVAEAEAALKTAQAAQRQAWARYHACMKQCQQTAIDEGRLTPDQLTNGYGVEGGKVVHDPSKYQRRHRVQTTFSPTQWRSTISTRRGSLPKVEASTEQSCLEEGDTHDEHQHASSGYHDPGQVYLLQESAALCAGGSALVAAYPVAFLPAAAAGAALPLYETAESVTAVTQVSAQSLAQPLRIEGLQDGLVKLLDPALLNMPLPVDGIDAADFADIARNTSPLQGVSNGGVLELSAVNGLAGGVVNAAATTAGLPMDSFNVAVDTTSYEAALAALPASLRSYVAGGVGMNNQQWLTFNMPRQTSNGGLQALRSTSAVHSIEANLCRLKQFEAAGDFDGDPYFDAPDDDASSQWAVKALRIPDAWLQMQVHERVVVAVIDTGLDWFHPDLDANSLWRNTDEVPYNGRDDDGNGFVDDVIGWDFVRNSPKPWDFDGHGTLVAGIIAARTDNGKGIAGVNDRVQLMILRALDEFGGTRASHIARAIVYAVDNGAHLINISSGGAGRSAMEAAAIAYAREKDVLVIAASGNEGQSIAQYGPAGDPGVLTVAATNREGLRAPFSNWGAEIDVAAPGTDIVSLRARGTDTMRDIPGVNYVAGSSFVGDDAAYYRAEGTSFSAPLVTGVASLLRSARPDLDASTLERLLTQTARDAGAGGVDQFTGFGIVDAAAAMRAPTAFHVIASIDGVALADTGDAVVVSGTADADDFAGYVLEMAPQSDAEAFVTLAELQTAVSAGELGRIPLTALAADSVWLLRIVARHTTGAVREARFELKLQ